MTNSLIAIIRITDVLYKGGSTLYNFSQYKNILIHNFCHQMCGQNMLKSNSDTHIRASFTGIAFVQRCPLYLATNLHCLKGEFLSSKT